MSVRKGAADSVKRWVVEQGGVLPNGLDAITTRIGSAGGTPLVVATGADVLGVIYLKDIVKDGMHHRFAQLRTMGIRTG